MTPSLKVRADREKTHRVVVNGIRNALQAMGAEGVLRISVQPEGRWVKIQVEDTGPGIPRRILYLQGQRGARRRLFLFSCGFYQSRLSVLVNKPLNPFPLPAFVFIPCAFA
jgi:hypothetical protein